MLTERQRVLRAVLRARGPTNHQVLWHHPVIQDHYEPDGRDRAIEADLEALVDAGEAVAWTSCLSGATFTEAYDVAGVERTGIRARYQRALREYREGRREHSPER